MEKRLTAKEQIFQELSILVFPFFFLFIFLFAFVFQDLRTSDWRCISHQGTQEIKSQKRTMAEILEKLFTNHWELSWLTELINMGDINKTIFKITKVPRLGSCGAFLSFSNLASQGISFLGFHQRLVFWNSIHQEVASDSFCFLINSSWLLVFILNVFSFFTLIF